jgi:hypothetical protein
MKKAINNKNILHFLAKEAVNNLHCDISGICSYSAELISLRLLKEGFSDFLAVEGYVRVPGWTGRTTHSWIELLDGSILDPSFEQFPEGTVRLETFQKKYKPQQYLNEVVNKHLVPDGINRYANSITDGVRKYLGFVLEAAPPKKDSSKKDSSKDEPAGDTGGEAGAPDVPPTEVPGEPFKPASGGGAGAPGGDVFGKEEPMDDMGGGAGEVPPEGGDEKSKISNYSEKLKSAKVIKYQKLQPEPGYKFEPDDNFYKSNYVGTTKNGSILLAVPTVDGKDKERALNFIKKLVLPKIEPVIKNALSQQKRVVLMGDSGMPYIKGKYAPNEQGMIAKYLNEKYKGGYVIFDTWAPQEYFAFTSNDELWQEVKTRTDAKNLEIKSALYLYLLTTIHGRKFANKLKTENVLKTIESWGLSNEDVQQFTVQGLAKIAGIVYPELTGNPETLASFIIKIYLHLLRVNMMQKVLKYEKEGKLVIVLSDEHTAWALKPSFDKMEEFKKEQKPPAEKEPAPEKLPKEVPSKETPPEPEVAPEEK